MKNIKIILTVFTLMLGTCNVAGAIKTLNIPNLVEKLNPYLGDSSWMSSATPNSIQHGISLLKTQIENSSSLINKLKGSGSGSNWNFLQRLGWGSTPTPISLDADTQAIITETSNKIASQEKIVSCLEQLKNHTTAITDFINQNKEKLTEMSTDTLYNPADKKFAQTFIDHLQKPGVSFKQCMVGQDSTKYQKYIVNTADEIANIKKNLYETSTMYERLCSSVNSCFQTLADYGRYFNSFADSVRYGAIGASTLFSLYYIYQIIYKKGHRQQGIKRNAAEFAGFLVSLGIIVGSVSGACV